jgi:hypothetical protein
VAKSKKQAKKLSAEAWDLAERRFDDIYRIAKDGPRPGDDDILIRAVFNMVAAELKIRFDARNDPSRN